jgi:hypothetical protein
MTPATSGTQRAAAERRTWQRLPLAIPVFVRGADRRGNEFFELTMASDIGGGGALVAIRHCYRSKIQKATTSACVAVRETLFLS